jgi:hypothetical protein
MFRKFITVETTISFVLEEDIEKAELYNMEVEPDIQLRRIALPIDNIIDVFETPEGNCIVNYGDREIELSESFSNFMSRVQMFN